MDFRQILSIKKQNEKLILKVCPDAKHKSGIYVFYRIDEEWKRHAYVGQSVDVLERCATHLMGRTQHIDLSLVKHKLFDATTNPFGYELAVEYFPKEELDEKEKLYIAEWQANGWQLKNKTAGGQGEGKIQIAEYKPSKGYRDGVKQGEKNAQKQIAQWFDKSLDFVIKPPTNKNKQKAYDKFKEFLEK